MTITCATIGITKDTPVVDGYYVVKHTSTAPILLFYGVSMPGIKYIYTCSIERQHIDCKMYRYTLNPMPLMSDTKEIELSIPIGRRQQVVLYYSTEPDLCDIKYIRRGMLYTFTTFVGEHKLLWKELNDIAVQKTYGESAAEMVLDKYANMPFINGSIKIYNRILCTIYNFIEWADVKYRLKLLIAGYRSSAYIRSAQFLENNLASIMLSSELLWLGYDARYRLLNENKIARRDTSMNTMISKYVGAMSESCSSCASEITNINNGESDLKNNVSITVGYNVLTLLMLNRKHVTVHAGAIDIFDESML